MAQTDQTAGGAGALVLADLLLDLHTRAEPGRILAAAVEVGTRLGAPFALAFRPFDPGAGAWYVTALLAPDGSPVALDALGVPLGPVTLDPGAHSDDGAVRPLTAVLGSAWGADACRRIEGDYGVRGVRVCSVGGEPPSSSKLLALLHDEASAPAVGRLLDHAALALERAGPLGAEAPDRVLPPGALMRQLAQEVARAQRYERPFSVVYAALRSHEEVARAGPLVGHRLRRWDAIGRLEGSAPVLVIGLPETTPRDAAAFVRRNAGRFGGARPGIAAVPDDGTTVERVLDAARQRSVPDQTAEEETSAAETWYREGSAPIAWQGRMPDQVRCPTCSTLYLRPRRTGATPAELEDQRAAARAELAALCPDHGEQVEV